MTSWYARKLKFSGVGPRYQRQKMDNNEFQWYNIRVYKGALESDVKPTAMKRAKHETSNSYRDIWMWKWWYNMKENVNLR